MQTKPHNTSHILLTVFGLGLLILVILFNHYHPRNQGVANINHGSIYQLALNVTQSSKLPFPPMNHLQGAVTTTSNQSYGNNVSANAGIILQSDTQISASSESNNVVCNVPKITQAQIMQRPYDEVSKNDDQNNNMANLYQAYKNNLEIAYLNYQQNLLNDGCQTQGNLPLPQILNF